MCMVTAPDMYGIAPTGSRPTRIKETAKYGRVRPGVTAPGATDAENFRITQRTEMKNYAGSLPGRDSADTADKPPATAPAPGPLAGAHDAGPAPTRAQW